ncbi:MAG: hypothetical protein V7647_421 [Acidobacteriota bacterium]
MPFTCATLALILSYTWVIDRWLPPFVGQTVIGCIIVLAIWHSARSGEWGFDRQAFLPGLKAAGVVTIAAAILILAAGAWLGTLHDRRDFLGSLAPLVLWGGAQQWLLQTLVLDEARHTVPPRAAVVLAATLFALVHLPNPFLTAVTFAGGLAWCAIYVRYPNILPLALSHGLGTLAILYAFDPHLTGRLRVGYSYLLLAH